MEPVIEENIIFSKSNEMEMRFTLRGVNVSIANAIRRTILADINTVVFNTKEQTNPDCVIKENTSRLTNEVIKQRLSCIPIHIQDLKEFDINTHVVKIEKENNSKDNSVEYVTTEDFKIINLDTQKEIDESKRREIFPPSNLFGKDYYIDFLRLRPGIGDIPPEKIHLVCRFSVGNAKEDGMFNVVSTCAYKYTIDVEAQNQMIEELKKRWTEEGKTEDQIDFEIENWKLLDGCRMPYTKQNSFDFVIESVGVFDPVSLVTKACNIINRKLDDIYQNDITIISLKQQNTIENAFDIVLHNDDYTVGKVLEYMLFANHYQGDQSFTYCGFKKVHPHDPDSIIRIATLQPTSESTIKDFVKQAARSAIEVFCKIREEIRTKSKK